MSTGEHQPDAEAWRDRLSRWAERLRAAHLDHAVGAALDLCEPLGPIGAQVLWVAQPTLGLFVPRGEVASLARLLESPGGLAWVRDQLTGQDSESDRHE